MNDSTCGRIADVLNQDITNRYCADCGIFLSDTNKIYTSFLPTSFHIDDRWFHKDWIKTEYGKNFVEMHEAFAPAGKVPSTSCGRITSKAFSGFIANARNDRVALKSIAHGVFICEGCAIVHSKLNPSTTKVKLASDPSWSDNEYNKMVNKGNTHGNNILEKFMPEEWLDRKKNHFENSLEREVFIRYKYEVLDFVFPHIRYGYKTFKRKNQSMTKKKWKSLATKVDKGVDWSVWTLGYKDYKDIKKSSKVPKSSKSKKKKKYRVSLQTAQEATRCLVDERRKKINLISSIIKLQAKFRMVMVNKRQLQDYKHTIRSCPCPSFMDVLRRTVIIQSRTRSYLMTRDFSTKKIVTITIQAHFRGRKIRLLYSLTREIIINIQAFIRGCLSRSKIHSIMRSRSSDYKEQIVTLWERTHTPLAYRTKFWMHINSPGYSTFASQEFELRRLWKLLEFDFQKNKVPKSCDESILADITYSKYLCVQHFLRRLNYVFAVTLDSDGDGFKLLENYAEQLQLERVQVYERLQRFDGVDHLYQRAGIGDEKYKKVKLARSIWNLKEMPLQPESALAKKRSLGHVWSEIEKSVKADDLATGKTIPIMPDISADIFDQLFPELRRSTNIKLIMPSKKSLDRIGVNESQNVPPIPLPLEESTMNFKANMDQQIIHNLAEVSRCFVTGVKHLALAGTLSSGFEKFFVEDRQFEAIDSTKYSLVHRFLHTSSA